MKPLLTDEKHQHRFVRTFSGGSDRLGLLACECGAIARDNLEMELNDGSWKRQMEKFYTKDNDGYVWLVDPWTVENFIRDLISDFIAQREAKAERAGAERARKECGCEKCLNLS